MKREHLDMLSLREAYEQIYIPASPDLAPRTIVKYRHLSNRWERHTRNPMIGELDTADFIAYRNALKDSQSVHRRERYQRRVDAAPLLQG